MKSRYQRLLPGTARSHAAGGQSSDSSGGGSSLPTCSVNPVACERCRRKKAKCNGQRPTCDRCARNGTNCQYDADVGESRSSALKKKYSALEKDALQLRREVHQLKRLYGYICASDEGEAFSVFERIRASGNTSSIDALRSVNQDEFLPTPEFTESPKSPEMSDDPCVDTVNNLLIKLQAMPWSVVAGDEAVSELVSQYFAFDYLYVFPPILRHTFIEEMKLGDIEAATCCAPLLVNAICAQQCFISPKEYIGPMPRLELAERFLDEAYRLLQNEGGRISLATCQATCLMYAAVAARDQLNPALVAGTDLACKAIGGDLLRTDSEVWR